jgi:hypothetical protein
MKEPERYDHDKEAIAVEIRENQFGVHQVTITNSASSAPADQAHLSDAIVGLGATRDLAVADAVQHLEWMLDTLQGPPPELRGRHGA